MLLAARYSLIGVMPTVPSVVVGSLLVCSLDAWMLGSFACAGDVYGNDPVALGQSFAWLQMMPFVGKQRRASLQSLHYNKERATAACECLNS